MIAGVLSSLERWKRHRLAALLVFVLLFGIGDLSLFRLTRPAMTEQQVTDMSDLCHRFETGAGLEMPDGIERLCVFFHEDSLNVFLYLRLDVDDVSKVRSLKWLQQSQPAAPAAVYPVGGPPDVYHVPWWDIKEIAEDADKTEFVSPKALDTQALACIAERHGRASVFLELPSEHDRYSPAFLAFIRSYPISVWSLLPSNMHAFGGCWRRISAAGVQEHQR